MLRLLIVEDEPTIALDLAAIVEDAGYIVVGMAPSMARALALADVFAIDIAIMDLELSGQGDGVETARRLRERHGIKSLYVSASIDDKVRAMAAPWSPVGFIAKPFREDQVLSAIRGMLPAD